MSFPCGGIEPPQLTGTLRTRATSFAVSNAPARSNSMAVAPVQGSDMGRSSVTWPLVSTRDAGAGGVYMTASPSAGDRALSLLSRLRGGPRLARLPR